MKIIIFVAFDFLFLLGVSRANCNNNNCQNGAQCISINDKYNCNNDPRSYCFCIKLNDNYNWGYECQCRPGYVGAQCQWDNDSTCPPSTTTACTNDSECNVINPRERKCLCAGNSNNWIQYGGHYCEKVNPCSTCPRGVTSECHSEPSLPNGRLCIDGNGRIIFNQFNEYA